jgi:RNA polymerase sigma-70 factor (ECF subfamily)
MVPKAFRIRRVCVYNQQAMDSDAFVDAHRRHAAAVYARCRRILRDADAAHDVTQEVFIRCFDRRAKLRTGRELLAWLYRVATNLCLNHLRNLKSQRLADADLAQLRPAWQEKPSASEVLELLTGLDERTQAIAVYVHVDGMTHAEAAEVAQVSDRTVRNCLTRFAEHGQRRAALDPGLQGGKA